MSYNTIAEADLYFSTMFGYENWVTVPVGDKPKILESASQLLDSMCEWTGKKVSSTQKSAFPRTPHADPVPDEIKIAELEIAYAVLAQGGINKSSGGDAPLTELKAGSATLKFDTSGGQTASNPFVNTIVARNLSGYGNCAFGNTRIIPLRIQ